MAEEAEALDIEFDESGGEQSDQQEPFAFVDNKQEEDNQPGTSEEEGEEERAQRESEEAAARIEFTPEQQAKMEDIIRKRTAAPLDKLKEEQQARQRAEQELQRMRPQQQQQEGRPLIPDPPDPFDDNYDQDMQKYRSAVEEAAKWDAVQSIRQELERDQYQRQQQESMQQLQDTVKTYAERAKKQGVSEDELKHAGQQVGSAQLNPNLVEFILQDEDGPRITTHLAANLSEVEKLKAMNPMRAAVYLETVIKPKATQRKKSNTPEPTRSPRGGGSPEKQAGPSGATYE